GAGYHLKTEAARSESLLLVHEIYISDFPIISAILSNISAIFQLYRLTDKSRQYQHSSPTFINILQSLLC
ncbi:hypothetical protein RAC77_25595, partial [Bacillus sp. BR_7]|uniref:hypothetical protein n=1 Tax=Bacillus sp. BR_7 TaxID=3055774 RepID=UPI0035BF068A